MSPGRSAIHCSTAGSAPTAPFATMRALRRSARRVPGTTYAVVSVSQRHSPARTSTTRSRRLRPRASVSSTVSPGFAFVEQRRPRPGSSLVGIGFVHARDEPHARGLGHASDRVARRPPLRDRGSGLDRAGAQLRPGQVERQCAALAGLALGPAQVLDHPLPDLGAVVGAVDAHDFHAGLDQVANQRRLVGRFAGHRHHDPRLPGRGARVRGSRPRASASSASPVSNVTGGGAAISAGTGCLRSV